MSYQYCFLSMAMKCIKSLSKRENKTKTKNNRQAESVSHHLRGETFSRKSSDCFIELLKPPFQLNNPIKRAKQKAF